MTNSVWVFNGENSRLPSGIFTTKQAAEEWVRANGLSGTLSEYPLDIGTYDHALANGLFVPKTDKEKSSWFKADFSPRMPHDHWSDGQPA